MDNAARWYDTLRRHDLFTVDDHAKMDELRITADRAAGEAEPPKAKHASARRQRRNIPFPSARPVCRIPAGSNITAAQ